MNGLLKEIEKRRAYRALDGRKIPADSIDRIITAATYAPSCANMQPWRFLAVSDEPLLTSVKGAVSERNYWVNPAPFIVVVCTKLDYDCERPEGRDYAYFDTGMAVSNMMLQGVKEGLHTHPIAGFEPSAMKEVLGIPDDVIALAVVVFGYPGDPSTLNEKHLTGENSDRIRKPIGETVVRDKWPESWNK
ncbi:MAG: nitroreductase family protein [Spirochaetales bacterium]|nr:nitroreductase family protein [Spirochaetales bacterium]